MTDLKSFYFPKEVADEMVRAILDGRKTVTRRVVKEPYYVDDEDASRVSGLATHRGINMTDGMPYPDSPHLPGDILYVRETWALVPGETDDPFYRYCFKADNEPILVERWHPSVHMERKAARIFLRVTDVRVERLQDIDENGAKMEGAETAFEYNTPEGPIIVLDEDGYYNLGFKQIWNSTIKSADRAIYGWDANPWVWVIEFERCEKPEEG